MKGGAIAIHSCEIWRHLSPILLLNGAWNQRHFAGMVGIGSTLVDGSRGLGWRLAWPGLGGIGGWWEAGPRGWRNDAILMPWSWSSVHQPGWEAS